jgi:hypothetical protein
MSPKKERKNSEGSLDFYQLGQQFKFCGRTKELETLTGVVKQMIEVTNGRRGLDMDEYLKKLQVAGVSGPSGIGKSRFLRELAQSFSR